MIRKLIPIACILPLIACSTIPSGPSALVLPGQRKNEKQFRADDITCRRFAHAQLVSASHQPQTLGEGQLHFDIHYLQCMYGKGHLIPVSGEVITDPIPNSPSPSPSLKSPAKD